MNPRCFLSLLVNAMDENGARQSRHPGPAPGRAVGTCSSSPRSRTQSGCELLPAHPHPSLVVGLLGTQSGSPRGSASLLPATGSAAGMGRGRGPGTVLVGMAFSWWYFAGGKELGLSCDGSPATEKGQHTWTKRNGNIAYSEWENHWSLFPVFLWPQMRIFREEE